jgi:hypothetical protein
MSCIRLADKGLTLDNNEMIMLKLYEALWGQRRKHGLEVIFQDQCKVPHAEDHIDDMVVDNSKHSFRYIELPDDVAFPATDGTLKPPRTKLLIRPCYEKILKHLIKTDKSVAVLGGPGIGECIKLNSIIPQLTRGTGKTLLLSYILVKKLLAAESVAYQSQHGTVFCFNVEGVFAYTDTQDLPEDSTRWHLVDSNAGLDTLPYRYLDLGHVVQATSPRISRYKDWLKYAGGREIWMEPFSWEEMYVTA